MRDLIIADILSDEALLKQMRSSDLADRIEAFQSFYENYKNHLPDSLGMSVDKIKGMKKLFDELSAPVYKQIENSGSLQTKRRETYRLIPVGFEGIFRGRAGMTDCSFDKKWTGSPYTRAMHEDTMYYFVYKGNTPKGYVGLYLDTIYRFNNCWFL